MGTNREKDIQNIPTGRLPLEGNFAFAAGVQEMLIQSHTGIIHIFPAIPENWKDVSFTSLRTEGAFLVSVRQKDGKIQKVAVTSDKGGTCKLKNPFGPDLYQIKYSWEGFNESRGGIF